MREHLDGCAGCRRLRDAQQGIRSLLRSRSLGHEAPLGLRTRILVRLDDVETPPAGIRMSRLAAMVMTGLAAVLVLTTWRESTLTRMGESYHGVLGGEVALAIRTDSVGELERFYAEHAPGMPTHVVDLGAAGFRLVGGVLREVEGRVIGLAVYSDGQALVVCDYRHRSDFRGALPEGPEPLFLSRGGLSFRVLRVGDEVCILATRLPLRVFIPRLGGWA